MATINNAILSLENMKIRIRYLFEWFKEIEWRLERIQNPYTTVWLIVNGERELQLDEQIYQIRKGDLVIIPPYTSISLRSTKETSGTLNYLSLGCEWKIGAIDVVHLYQFPKVTPLENTQFEALREVWSTLRLSWDKFVEMALPEHAASLRIELQTDQAKGFFEIKGLLFQWLAKVFHTLQEKLPVAPKLVDDRVQKVCHFIDHYYGNKLTLKCLSEIVFLGESQIRVLFKKSLNVSPMNYILQVRLQKAKELLMLTEEPIGRIGEVVGFEELSYFSRMFRNKEKVSPAEYRRKTRTLHV
jgi:AraC-like DNA-binding protein